MIETPNFEIIRSIRRRRVAIQVHEGKVQVLVPKRLSENDAIQFLNQHLGWVQKKLREQQNTSPYRAKEYLDGEAFLFLGKNYFLNIAYAKKPTVLVRDDQLFVFIRELQDPTKRKQKIHQQLRAWYYQQAECILQQKSEIYAEQLGVQSRSITIRQFKSRWGSCSTRGDIQYSWPIILAPHAIVDYLVVHELSHLKHHNHSPRFWNMVGSMIPDYKACRQWLKMHGHLLKID